MIASLANAVRRLARCRQLDDVGRVVRDVVREIVPTDGLSFVLRRGDEVHYVEEHADAPLWKGQSFPFDTCVTGLCMRGRAPVAIHNVATDARISPEAYRDTFVQSLVVVPIDRDEPVGAIAVYWAQPHQATDEEIKALQAVADSTAVALENIKILSELEERVALRTVELTSANSALQREVELRRTIEQQLRTTREQLDLALRAGNVGLFSWNVRTGEVFQCPTWKGQIGYRDDELPSSYEAWESRLHPDDRETTVTRLRSFLNAPWPNFEIEFRLQHKDGSYRRILSKCDVIRGADGKTERMMGCHLDVTEQRAAERLVQESQRRLQALLDNTPAVIYLKDAQGRYQVVNRRYEELFHIRNEDIQGKNDFEVFPPHLAEVFVRNDEQVRQTRQAAEFEEYAPHDDEPHLYLSVKFPIIEPTTGDCAVGGISTDINDRKRAEQALRDEQDLLRHLIEVQESERQLVAYDIHDGLVQYATAAQMYLETFLQNPTADTSRKHLDTAASLIQKTVTEGRRLINGLRPPILDESGVVAAIEHLIHEPALDVPNVELVADRNAPRLPAPVESTLYRIVQEALSNVRKHSGSQRVRVTLSRLPDAVRVEVQDWGVGFMPQKNQRTTFGLRGISERVRLLGGTYQLESTPGQGTRLAVELPIAG